MAIAAIVPVGIDFDASARSPDLFDPAMIPAGQKFLYFYEIVA